jgi:hypothetical protein
MRETTLYIQLGFVIGRLDNEVTGSKVQSFWNFSQNDEYTSTAFLRTLSQLEVMTPA